MAEGKDVVLKLDGVSKRFGAFLAVDNVSFEVRRGEFVTLLGPSGCGKTSTLRVVAGFLYPDGGRVMLEGKTVNDQPPYLRDIGMVFQSYALFPHMTVERNVGFGLRMRRIGGADAAQRVREALALVRLDGYGERYPSQLSGGQQQRVAIARALVIRPPLLLMDEPMSNLDALLRAEMQFELRNIVERAGVTTINVTHNQEEAMSMSDRVVVMSAGRVEQVGAPIEVYHRPHNEFVANFLGRSNLISCRITARDDGQATAATAGGATLTLKPGSAAVGDEIMVQIRPEAIAMSAGAKPGANAFPGNVVQRAFMGAFFEYLVEAGGQRFLVRAPGSAYDRAYGVGDAVTLSWSAESAVNVARTRPPDR